jgi:adenylate cyclase
MSPPGGKVRVPLTVARGALALVALGLGVAINAASGDSALDRLTPTDVAVDPRVVVVSFDGRTDLGADSELRYLRGTVYRDLARDLQRGGARAVGFVDFDSLSFSDGAQGRANVVDSPILQAIAVAPLIDIGEAHPSGQIPFLTRYRVDPLASELAGTGLPSGPSNGVLRSIPAVARVATLEDGEIVSIPDFVRSAFADDAKTVVPGVALRLVELGSRRALSSATPDGVRLGDKVVPLENSDLRIRWSDGLDNANDPSVISSGVFQAGGIPDDSIRDAIVLVGTTDPASAIYVDTPMGPLPEVLVQANALNTVLTEQYSRPDPRYAGLLAGAAAAVLIVLLPTRRKWLVPLCAAAILLGWLIVVRIATADGLRLDALTVPISGVAAAALVGARGQLVALAERRRLRALFSQYVAPSIADQLVKSGRGELASAGERVAITAVFCDLRGFTAVAARLQPSEVRAMLNVYYEELGAVVFACGGTVMQYTGDEIFAVFGAPLPMPDHAAAGVRCATEMFEHLTPLNDQLLAAGLPAVNFGIGVHSGDVIAAHVGSSIRMQYTVIGDTVNVASRHCTLARNGQIALSDVTAALIGPLDGAERLDGLEMKGLSGNRSAFLIQAGPSAASGSPDLVRPTVDASPADLVQVLDISESRQP